MFVPLLTERSQIVMLWVRDVGLEVSLSSSSTSRRCLRKPTPMAWLLHPQICKTKHASYSPSIRSDEVLTRSKHQLRHLFTVFSYKCVCPCSNKMDIQWHPNLHELVWRAARCVSGHYQRIIVKCVANQH